MVRPNKRQPPSQQGRARRIRPQEHADAGSLVRVGPAHAAPRVAACGKEARVAEPGPIQSGAGRGGEPPRLTVSDAGPTGSRG